MSCRGRLLRWILARAPVCARLRFIPLLLLLCASAWAQTGPTVTTDQSDYPPGSTAQITGSGFHASETVTLQVVHTDTTVDLSDPDHQPWTVTTDANGSFSSSWAVSADDVAGSSFKLTADCMHPVDATDTTPHLHAETTFADSDNQPPVTTASGNGGAYSSGTWTNVNVSVALTAIDLPKGSNSGVKNITYSAAGAQTIASTTVPGASAMVPTITIEGTTTISFHATDNAGNVENTQTFIVKIDKTAPAVTVNQVPNGTVGTPMTITGTASDGASGLASLQVTIKRSSDNTVLATGNPTVTAGNWSFSYTPAEASQQTAIATATDVAGNSNSDTNKFLVKTANTAPTVTASANQAANACVSASFQLGSFSDPDNGPWSVDVNWGDGTAHTTFNAAAAGSLGSQLHTYVSFTGSPYTVAVVVTDALGASGSGSFTVTVSSLPPTITCPANVMVSTDPGKCTASNVNLGTPTTGDNCGVKSVTNNAPAQFPVGTTTVTWTVTDVNGLTNTCTQTVTVTDNQPPSIACPAAVSVNADAGRCYASNVNLGTPTTSDNCGVKSVTNNAPTQFPVGTTNVVWTVADASGNTATCTQTVTVADKQAPTIACPPAVTVNTDPGQCTAVVSDATLGSASASDNCPGVTVTRSGVPAGNVFPKGTTTITYTATDAAGNTATCTQTVTVNDTEKPTITCPSAVTVNTGPGKCTASGVVLGTPTTSDNCSVASVTNNAPATFPVGTTNVVWTVTDTSGNTATCTQAVTVVDKQNPTITCPANVTQTADPGKCSASLDPGTATATDNCHVASIVGMRSDAKLLTDPYPVGTTTITWTATDDSGNSSTCSQTIIVTDNEKPVIICPANVTQTADPGQCSATVTAQTLGAGTATDNCPGVTVSGARSDGKLLSDPYPVGTTTITWTATDAHGNSSTCAQTVTVTDNEKPVITCPANVTQTADPGQCSASLNPGTATATDNCHVASIVGARSDGKALTDPYPVGSTTITWTATDDAGNSTACTQAITVTDNEKPVITCPANVTQTADAGKCSAVVAVGQARSTDNCHAASIVGARSDAKALTDPYPVGTTTLTWTATDDSGNSSTCSQTITVTDNEKPVITCPKDLTQTADPGKCSAVVVVGTATGTDNCHVASIVGARSDGKPLTDPYPVGTTTITWTATDDSGNSSTCSQTIIVTDNEKPVITCPANITQTADSGKCSASLSPGMATATDNCPGVTVSGARSDGKSLSDPYPVGTTTITWTATDAHGNSSTGSQTVTVTDNEKPVITCPANVTQTADAGKCSAVVAVGNATASDNCHVASVVGARSDGKGLADPYPVGTTTITWTATDDAGNNTTCAQAVTVTDNEKPAITCPANITQTADSGKCSAVVAVGNATATDNCHVASIVGVRSDGKPLTDPYPVGTTTITWTATDDSGNSSTCTQTITVTDNEKPVITCPANINQTADAGKCSASLNPGQATATDNCHVASLGGVRSDAKPLTDAYPVGTTTITWTADDDSGNSSTCTQTVTVTDNEKPVITCPANITQTADAGKCSAVVAVGTATATDNCRVASIVGARSDGKPLPDPYPVGSTTITWTATDDAGNSSTCTQTITVTDNEKPVITCPKDVTQTADPHQCSAVVAVGQAMATDNCHVASVVGVRSDNKALTDPYPVGTTAITWTAADDAGNITACKQTITVTDNENPVITCPKDLAQTADPGKCSAVVAAGNATATDNCHVASIVGTRSDGKALTDPYPVGTTTITWTATDDAGNSITCLQTLTVTDNEKPVITCPANVTQTADAGKCSAVVTVGTATGTDNCHVASIGGVRSDGKPLADPYPVGTTTITWTAIDDAGNSSACSQTITVADNEKPVITCPANITQTADAGKCSAVVAVGAATGTDNCHVASVVGARSDGKALTDPYPVGTTTITWTATDDSGNSSTCTQTITVTDNEKPVITCPANITQTADAGMCSASLNPGNATGTDNCHVASIGGVRSDGKPLTDPYPVGTTTITWTATDDSGNSSTCTQTITVTDNEKPVITCPANVTQTADPGKCSAVVAVGTATGTDNCHVASIVGTRSDNKPLTDPYPVGTTTITWTATDDSGNSSTCSQTVTVTDNEKPVITCPANVTQTADPGKCSAVVTVGAATGMDNCHVASIVGARSDAKALTDPYPVGTTTITWTATDDSGNSSTCTQTITVTDNEKPVITCPASITQTADAGKCSAVVAVGAATGTDNCDVASIVGTRSDSKSLTDPYPVGTTTITWTATDDAGNSSTCTQTITVTDNEKPVITCPANVTQTADAGKCSATVTAQTLGAATATDNCAGVTVSGARSDGKPLSDPYAVGATTITWTATDAHGNSSTCSQTVTVTDNEKPVITCPANLTVNSGSGLCSASAAHVNAGTATATDNCAGVTVSGTRSDGKLLTDPYPVGTTTITWTATDAHGNSAQCVQSIMVNDAEKPVISCPANMVVCGDPVTGQATVTFAPTATDNCPGVTVSCSPASGSVFSPGVTTVTCTATDKAGNTSTCSFTVTVNHPNCSFAGPTTVAAGQTPGYGLMVNPAPGSTITWSVTDANQNPIGTIISGQGTSAITWAPPTVTVQTTVNVSVTVADAASGCTSTCSSAVTVLPVTVSAGMRDPNTNPLVDTGFDVVFTPGNGSSLLQLTATNPGAFMCITSIKNNSAAAVMLNQLSLDLPTCGLDTGFCPSISSYAVWGSNPVHVYNGNPFAAAGATEITPSGVTFALAGGGTAAQPLSTSTTLVKSTGSVTLPPMSIPAGGSIWVQVLMRYALIGTTGWPANCQTAFVHGYRFNSNCIVGGMPLLGSMPTDCIATGKKVTGIGGYATDTTGKPKGALRIVVAGTTVIDPATGNSYQASWDHPNATTETNTGWYFVSLPANSSPNQTVSLYSSADSKLIATRTFGPLAAGQFIEVDFPNLSPSDPVIEGVVGTVESGVSGVTVELINVAGKVVSTTTTNSGGYYAFRFAAPGTYSVRIIPPAGYGATVTQQTRRVDMFQTVKVDFTLVR